MISYTNLTQRALEVVVDGRVTQEDVCEAFARIDLLLETTPKFDILADVREGVHIDLAAIAEELKHLGAIGRMLGALDRMALVADPAWIRMIGRIESHLIPGIDYRVFDRDGAAEARAFILRADQALPA
jgi:hypothetical protein